MESFDLNKYKQSKILVVQLEAILKIIDLTERGLAPFGIYLPVYRLLMALRDEKRILQSFYEKTKAVKESKGRTH